MDSSNFISKSLRQEHLKKISGLRYEDEEKYELQSEIRNLLKKNNALLIAHYYTDPAIQDLALDTDGCVADSLDMAKFGANTESDTLVVCGVKFMGETAKFYRQIKLFSCRLCKQHAHLIWAVKQRICNYLRISIRIEKLLFTLILPQKLNL
jgi:predicted molibdopterin-dependent oxidoreductase YjgC